MERRRITVTLYPGNFEAEIADLERRALAAAVAETSAVKRAGTRSESMRLAKERDDRLAEASTSAVDVTVWAISYLEWGPLADEHPPRDDDPGDKRHGVNLKTFPLALLKVSLVTPGEAKSFDDLKARGESALTGLGEISRVQYAKLETGAWEVNVGDDALPKYSLVSLLKQQRGPDSSEPSDSQ